MAPERRNLYRILHVQPEAPLEVIRASYRTLMSTLRAHPDLGGDPEAAARINAAYAVLTDPARRRAYDQQLRAAGRAPARAPTPAPAPAAAPPPAAAPSAAVAQDAATWRADRACPFCRHALPAALHADSRCAACDSPLFPRPHFDRGELLGRRRSPRSARALAAALRLPGRPGDHPARLRDLSLSGLCLLSPLPAAERSAMRIVTADFDAVAVIVGCRRHGGDWLLHGELLTLRLLRSQGVFVSASA
ncbi:MAG: DnaJ domain-containing protein [Rubrivivax sp.]